MYDALTTTYRLSCPRHGETGVRLSRFRRIDVLPGTSRPAVFRVEFSCRCGAEHPGLVPHDELDWAPLGLGTDITFLNLMTARAEPVADELGDLAARRIGAGEWPWSFFCWPEDRPRPVFPSAFRMLWECGPGDRVAVAVRCPACDRLSVNLVTREHIDVPFHDDREVGVVGHILPDDAAATLDAFRAELYSSGFESRLLGLS